MTAESAFDASATLVTVTVYVPGLVGAVYTPVLLTVPLAEPPSTAQVTAITEVPVTSAVRLTTAPGPTVAVFGVTLTATVGTTMGSTVRVAESDFVGSATLVAVTVNVPARRGARYTPVLLTVPLSSPPSTDHCTARLFVPVTCADREKEASCTTVPVFGETVTATSSTTTGSTVMEAEAFFVGSATLVAVTVNVPVFFGARYTPVLLTKPFASPPSTDHCTARLLVPVTSAVRLTMPSQVVLPDEGLTVTTTSPTTTGSTVTEAEPFFVGSATLVAVTVNVPGVLGAVYLPVLLTVPFSSPPSTDHCTAVMEEPETSAVSWVAVPWPMVTTSGVTFTMTVGVWTASTLTVAVSFFEVSTALVATTVYVPASAGAV